MMEQTLDDVEFIFVDDCTNDRSVEILKNVISEYPNRKDQVRIIHHEKNKGLPSARNTGLAIAQGDYVFHWDSDDYADKSMLEEMYEFASDNNLDLVWTDWYLTFAENERYMKQPDYNSPLEALKGMLAGSMKYNVWNKLAKRSLYTGNDIRFPDGYGMGEDLTMLLVFAHANNSKHLPKSFYHYLKTNQNAFSHSIKSEHFSSLTRNIEWVCQELSSIFGNSLEKEYNLLKLDSKYPLISCSKDINNYRIWNTWFPEANKMITKPRNISMRRKILEISALYRIYPILWLHSLILNIYYGIIYR